MGSDDGIRIVDVDSALAAPFLDYVRVHGAEHDDSYTLEEELEHFEPAIEPASVVLGEADEVVGAASVMLDGYLAEGLGRFRILHALDPEVYPHLIAHILGRMPAEARRLSLFLPTGARSIEEALTLCGFAPTRHAYIVEHRAPAHTHVTDIPADTHFEQALPTAAEDWAHVVNAAFKGEPGRYDMTAERARELLARQRVIRDGTLLAWRGGLPAGVILTARDCDECSQAEIETIAVCPAHQGIGLGRAMLRTALHAAAEHSCTRVSLSVSAANKRALSLYLDAGFVVGQVRICWETVRQG